MTTSEVVAIYDQAFNEAISRAEAEGHGAMVKAFLQLKIDVKRRLIAAQVAERSEK